MSQCRGETLLMKRCKNISNDGYCRFHKNQRIKSKTGGINFVRKYTNFLF